MPNPTLDNWNDTEFTDWEDSFTPTTNGVDCNVCGTELKDTQPGEVTQGNGGPPQTPVFCDNCEFKGYRIVFN